MFSMMNSFANAPVWISLRIFRISSFVCSVTTRGPRVVNAQTKDEMRKILREIQTGQFAKEFILENQVGHPVFDKYREAEKAHPIEEVGKRLRDMMSWIREAKKDSSDPNAR